MAHETKESPKATEKRGVKAQELAAFSEAARILASSPDLRQTFGPLTKAMNQLIPFDHAVLSWIDPNGYELHRLKGGFTGNHAGNARQVYSITDPSEANRLTIKTRLVFGQQIIGVLALERGQGGFTAQEQGWLEGLGHQAASAAQNARLYQQLQQPAGQLKWQKGQNTGGDKSREAQVDLAHILLTPITTIKGYVSSLLKSDVADSPELQQEFLKTIEQATDQLNEAVKGLLASLKYEPEHPDFEKTVTTIPDLFAEAEAHLSQERWLRPSKFQCDPDLPPVLVSQHYLLQAIGHLACYISSAAPCRTGLKVEALCRDGQPLICIGIDSEGLPTDPHSENLAESAGNSDESVENGLIDGDLRLIVCRNILEAHSVTLNTEISSDKAIKFWFALPAASEAP